MLEPILTDKLKKKIKKNNMKINWTRSKLNSGRVIQKSNYLNLVIVNMTEQDNKLLEILTKDIRKFQSNKSVQKEKFTKAVRK